ncbi:kinase-like domain-containing protein [Gongronella butleri]|nr:kinase-like domain-containing protein [Gongronella butleri]
MDLRLPILEFWGGLGGASCAPEAPQSGLSTPRLIERCQFIFFFFSLFSHFVIFPFSFYDNMLRKKRNFKNLTLSDSPVVMAPNNTEREYSQLVDELSELEIGLELQLDLRPEDFETLDELGRGNGGAVYKVKHVRTNTIMARKAIYVEANNTVRKQIIRELQFMHECNSKHIVSFYGAFTNGVDISICMEYMEAGSLDKIYKKHGPIRLDVLKKIGFAVADGLIYLYDEHRIIHRDLKPSNVLVNSKGQIKLGDFGVSGKLTDSLANTFVGTSGYMSPERIMGYPYSVKCDVWSVGIMMIELAMAKFPWDTTMSIFEMLQQIVHEPVPTFPDDPEKYPADLRDFVATCLVRDSDARSTPRELLEHVYLQSSLQEKVDLQRWALEVC